MYGIFETHILGRIAEDIVLRQNSEGKQYCYFRVAVPNRPQTDTSGVKKEKQPDWLDMSASGATASYLAKYAGKGTIISCWARGKKVSNTVEKDGVKTVYNDMTFYVYNGRCEIVAGFKTQEKEGQVTHQKEETVPATGQSSSRPREETVPSVYSNPEDDYGDIPAYDNAGALDDKLPY